MTLLEYVMSDVTELKCMQERGCKGEYNVDQNDVKGSITL